MCMRVRSARHHRNKCSSLTSPRHVIRLDIITSLSSDRLVTPRLVGSLGVATSGWIAWCLRVSSDRLVLQRIVGSLGVATYHRIAWCHHIWSDRLVSQHIVGSLVVATYRRIAWFTTHDSVNWFRNTTCHHSVRVTYQFTWYATRCHVTNQFTWHATTQFNRHSIR